MTFKKGDPRPVSAGRKKGSTNKDSLLVREILDNHGINLVDQILVRLKELDKDKQVAALQNLLPYVYPKLTSIEHSGEINNPYMEMSLKELEAEVKRKLNNDK